MTISSPLIALVAPQSRISARVISTNGRAAAPVTASRRPFFHSGAGISSADTNCEDRLASIVAVPPSARSDGSITTGGHRLLSSLQARTPRLPSASIRSPIGRSRIRALPSSLKRPRPRVRKPRRKRIAVPALPTKSSALEAGMIPPRPSISIRRFASSVPTWKPSARSAAIIWRVSSLKSAD